MDRQKIEKEVEDLRKQADAIADKAVRANRNMTDAEVREHERLAGQITATRKIINQLTEDELSNLQQMIDAEDGSHSNVARSLHGYAWNEKTGPSDPDFSMGRYIRAKVLDDWRDAQHEKRALSEGTSDALGGAFVPDLMSRAFLDNIRGASVTMRAGVRTIPWPENAGDTFSMATVISDPTVGWSAEASTASGDPGFARTQFVPKKLNCLIKVSREWLHDAYGAADALEQMLSGAMAAEIDRMILEGNGSGSTPSGLLSLTASGTNSCGSISSQTMGASGGAFTSASANQVLCDLIGACVRNNVDPKKMALIMHGRTWTDLVQISASGTGQPLTQPVRAFDGMPWLVCNGLSINTVSASSASGGSTIYAGDFSQALVAVREQFRLIIGETAYMTTDEVGIYAYVRADCAFPHPQAFARLTDITT